MNYYSFHIGDYASHTRHLTLFEDLAYRRLLDLYYLHERPLNECSTTVARLINMRENESEIAMILREFFELIPGVGYVNRRADAEIARFHGKVESASRAGKASAERRGNKRSTDVQRMFNDRSTDVQPTNNQEPITNISITDVIDKRRVPRFDAVRHLTEQGVDEQIARDWLTLRKTKKAAATETAIKGVHREACKANLTLQEALAICCQRGWAGFKAEWMNQQTAQPPRHPTRDDERAYANARLTGRIPVGTTIEQFMAGKTQAQGNLIEGDFHVA